MERVLVIPKTCRLLSRELLYTALTRQRDRIVLFVEGDVHELKRFAGPGYSEAAARLTNLFSSPKPVEVDDRFLEDSLIHRTLRGEAVRSKSEVVIANMLDQKGIDYAYEQPLTGDDGSVRYPDFTIEDAASGEIVYWAAGLVEPCWSPSTTSGVGSTPPGSSGSSRRRSRPECLSESRGKVRTRMRLETRDG